jgi:hypothetical protein
MTDWNRLNDDPPAESVSFLIYGPAKVGKTDWAGSTGDRTLYIDVGKSTETLKTPDFKKRRGNTNPILIKVNEKLTLGGNIVPDNPSGYDEVCDTIDKALKEIPDQFDTIVVDECTAFRKMALNKALHVNKETGKSNTLDNVKKHDVMMSTVQDYGTEMSEIEWFLSAYIDICKQYKKHFVVLAHERNIFDKPKNAKGEPLMMAQPLLIKTLPGFTGQTFPDAVCNLFDIVWHFEKVQPGPQYRIRTKGSDSMIAGDRFGGIFQEMEVQSEQNTFLACIKRIKEGIHYQQPTRR